VPICAVCEMHSVVFNKIDSSYMVSIRPFVALCPHFNLASSSPLYRNFLKGRVFPTNFLAICPYKICVSIFFTRLLHCPGPLCGCRYTPKKKCRVDLFSDGVSRKNYGNRYREQLVRYHRFYCTIDCMVLGIKYHAIPYGSH